MNGILKISDAASLALHSMIALARSQDKLLSVKEIAESLDVSANHLSKVMQRLVKAGLVESVKGAGGGFRLANSPENINFMMIFEAIEGHYEPSSCLLGKENCTAKCCMSGLLISVNEQVRSYFLETKLSNFL